MTATTGTSTGTGTAVFGLSREARNLQWLLGNLVEEVPGVRSVAVVSSDGLLLLSSDPVPDPGDDGPPTGGAQTPAGPGRGQEPDGPLPSRNPVGPRGSTADLATIVSGIASLTIGAAKLMDGGAVKQTMVAMEEGSVFVMSISDGSLLGVHATPDCDMSVVAYHMALFVGRAGHVLTPEVRGELRKSLESPEAPESPGSPGSVPVSAPLGEAR
ncbi:roadblock/LC7 domain-containing protein [Streptomyces lichenis]|uniref:Roadblock/LC7 domain-containing protein n=1 Tax=Streptomyces lichenis TaxID=2306967 RepID=A0ABT0I7W5_9ACTN|nr:roadblock/LC7 domain-containing protein [Streptomyces lichenis]MCK8677413.1 roadblock/LC7 domain-containing protein [Streptomyces lichenis]